MSLERLAMKTNQHTPGPWTIADDNGIDIGIIARKQGKGGQMVAMATVDEDVPQDDDERLSNARLIAAAPDLLAACKIAEGAFGALASVNNLPSGWHMSVVVQLLAAIAKAEGGAS